MYKPLSFETKAHHAGPLQAGTVPSGLSYIDHLTHNVHPGRRDERAGFYERLFNFRKIRHFDIEGQVMDVISNAMTSPCGKIRIPINEEGNEKAGQMQEYFDSYQCKRIQQMRRGELER